jgi:hypothetical protein
MIVVVYCSMVVDNMISEKIFLQDGKVMQNSGPDPFQICDANTILTRFDTNYIQTG